MWSFLPVKMRLVFGNSRSAVLSIYRWRYPKDILKLLAKSQNASDWWGRRHLCCDPSHITRHAFFYTKYIFLILFFTLIFRLINIVLIHFSVIFPHNYATKILFKNACVPLLNMAESASIFYQRIRRRVVEASAHSSDGGNECSQVCCCLCSQTESSEIWK